MTSKVVQQLALLLLVLGTVKIVDARYKSRTNHYRRGCVRDEPITKRLAITERPTTTRRPSREYPLWTPSDQYDVDPLLIYHADTGLFSYNFDTNSTIRLEDGICCPNGENAEECVKKNRELMGSYKNYADIKLLDYYYSDSGIDIFILESHRILKAKLVNDTILECNLNAENWYDQVVVDWIGRNFYWSGGGLIHSSKFDGSNVQNFASGFDTYASSRTLLIDSRYGFLFFSGHNWGLYRSRIDKEDHRELIQTYKPITGSALDFDALTIYWTEGEEYTSIHVIDYNGNNQRQIGGLLDPIKPFTLSLFENNLFWADSETELILTTDKHGADEVKKVLKPKGQVTRMTIAHPNRQPKFADTENVCAINNGNCSHSCYLNTDNTRRCSCPHFMKLANDEVTCMPHMLVYSVADQLKGIDFHTLNDISLYSNETKPKYVVKGFESNLPQARTGSDFAEIDFYHSSSESYIFCIDVLSQQIFRATLFDALVSNNTQSIVSGHLAGADSIAVDWIGKNIYWAESILDHIEVAKLDGSSRRILIAGDMKRPQGIVVDPRDGLLFWISWDSGGCRIERATMSGQERQVLISMEEVDGGRATSLTLDYEAREIFWHDPVNVTIHAIDYDGDNHRTLNKFDNSDGSILSMTILDDTLILSKRKYKIDYDTGIFMINKSDGSSLEEFHIEYGIYKLKSFLPERQPKVGDNLNPCAINNGNCSNLCLLTTNHARECL